MSRASMSGCASVSRRPKPSTSWSLTPCGKTTRDTAISWNFALDEGEFTPLLWGARPRQRLPPGQRPLFSEDSNHAGIEHREYHLSSAQLQIRACHGSAPLCPQHARRRGQGQVPQLYRGGGLQRGLCRPRDGGTEKEDCAEIARSARFLKAHKDLYLNSEPKTKLAIYRSNHSETMAFADEAVSRLAIEQTLIEESIQFDYVINDTLDRIGRYEAIVLPNAICVSDAAAEALAEYVRSGGRLLCTEGSLTKDEYGRKRVAVADMGLYGERDTSIGRTNAASDVDHLLYCLGLDASYSDRIVYLKKVIPEKPLRLEGDQRRAGGHRQGILPPPAERRTGARGRPRRHRRGLCLPGERRAGHRRRIHHRKTAARRSISSTMPAGTPAPA